jgi:integrase
MNSRQYRGGCPRPVRAGAVALVLEIRLRRSHCVSFPFRKSPVLMALLEQQRERAGALQREVGKIIPHVFFLKSGEPIRDYRTAWRTATRRAGIPGRHVHDLRRTAVRKLERAGVPRSWAMKLIGHKTEAM